MSWTQEEIDLLKSKNYNPYCETQASYNFSSHSGFDWYTLEKNTDGSVTYFSHYPVNVDPDDGSYDMEHSSEVHESLEAFFKHRK